MTAGLVILVAVWIKFIIQTRRVVRAPKFMVAAQRRKTVFAIILHVLEKLYL